MESTEGSPRRAGSAPEGWGLFGEGRDLPRGEEGVGSARKERALPWRGGACRVKGGVCLGVRSSPAGGGGRGRA